MENYKWIILVIVILVLLWYGGWMPTMSGFVGGGGGTSVSGYTIPAPYMSEPSFGTLPKEWEGARAAFNAARDANLNNYVYYRDYGWLIDHAQSITDPAYKNNMINLIRGLLAVERRTKDIRFATAVEKSNYYLQNLTSEINTLYNPPSGSDPREINGRFRTETKDPAGMAAKLLKLIRVMRNTGDDATFLAYVPRDTSIALAQSRLSA